MQSTKWKGSRVEIYFPVPSFTFPLIDKYEEGGVFFFITGSLDGVLSPRPSSVSLHLL